MAENLDILNTAVSLLIRAALLAARFSGRVRQRSLKRLASRDIDAQAKEILFLKDRVYQLEMQVTSLCREFESWYNGWRPHMTLEGFRPDDLYYGRKPASPNRKAKTVPGTIDRHVFAETRLTAYRLKTAA